MAATNPLTLLHITDTHDSFVNIKSLQLHLGTQGIEVDFVLVSGDISTMPMSIDLSDFEALSKYEHSIVQLLTEVYKICPNVVYIPGNHDPIKFFTKSESPHIKESIVNIHKDVFRLSDGLVVAGFGGSLPGYKSGEKVWDGFPYTQPEYFEADMEPFLASIFSNKFDSVISPDDVIILMTHVGPDGLPTAIDTTDPTNPITCGSVALRKCLEIPAQGRVILNIHGHTHAGVGHNRVGSVTVSNPGHLQVGRYALYKISKNEGKWNLNSIHLDSLH